MKMTNVEAIKRFLSFPLKKIDYDRMCYNCPFEVEDDACDKCYKSIKTVKKILREISKPK